MQLLLHCFQQLKALYLTFFSATEMRVCLFEIHSVIFKFDVCEKKL